jgi:uncharacterized protein (UPF0335 family)
MPQPNATSQLRQFVERLEALALDRKLTDEAIADTYRQAKGAGFEPKALKALLARRARDAVQAGEQDALVDVYAAQLAGEGAA